LSYPVAADLILTNGNIWRGRAEGRCPALPIWPGKVLAHGTDAAIAAAETARKTFEEGASDANLPTVSLGTDGLTVVQATAGLGFAPSNKEVRRKLAEGAIRVNGQVVTDPAMMLNAGDKLSFGAKKHGMIVA